MYSWTKGKPALSSFIRNNCSLALVKSPDFERCQRFPVLRRQLTVARFNVQLLNELVGHRHGNQIIDSLNVFAGRAEGGNSDDFSALIEARPAAVPVVDGGIGLNRFPSAGHGCGAAESSRR